MITMKIKEKISFEHPNCCGSTTANYAINKCDLLSVRIVTGDGALPFGAAVTVMYVFP